METKQMYFEAEKVERFSIWLAEQIKSQELNVTKLSRLSGVHSNTIRNYLAERCEPTLYNINCLLKALGYTFGAIPR